MSWIKKHLRKTKDHAIRPVKLNMDKVIKDIHAYGKGGEPILQMQDNMTEWVKKCAVLLVDHKRFTSDAKSLWRLGYSGELDQAEKEAFIKTHLPTICQSIIDHAMTVETENNAKAEYFSAHGFTKARLHRREKALLSIHKALDDAIRYVDAVEEEYDSFFDDDDDFSLERLEPLERLFSHILQGMRNFTTWQPAFAKIPGAQSLAKTLAEYEAQAISSEDTWEEWRAQWHRAFAVKGSLFEQEYEDLQDSFLHQCNILLDLCDELSEYALVLHDCLRNEEDENKATEKRLDEEYEKAQQEIKDDTTTIALARHIVDMTTKRIGR